MAPSKPLNFKWANFDPTINIGPTPFGSTISAINFPGGGAKPFVIAQTDKSPTGNDFIKLNFSGDLYENLTDAVTNNGWWYNADDGYFYYLDVLNGGDQTDLLLTSLYLESAAGANAWYKYIDFDLVVNMNAVQNLKDHLDAPGWNLPAGALRTELEKLCSDF